MVWLVPYHLAGYVRKVADFANEFLALLVLVLVLSLCLRLSGCVAKVGPLFSADFIM